jgi:tetratricopeptide (TPR) repeat protein
LLQKQGQFKAALDELEATEGPARSAFGALSLEGDLLGKLGIHDRELSVYESMIADFPDNPVLWMCLGNTLKTVGRSEEAVHALRRAIKMRPTYGEAYWTLANLKTFHFETRDLNAMRKALRGKLSPDDALHFHFSLGKALEDRDDAAESFRHSAAGNAIRASQLNISTAGIARRVNAAIACFSGDFYGARSEWGYKAIDPIFVVSLQRSGSTLIEQILASHPMIEGTAELMVLEQIWERLGVIEGKGGNSFLALASLGQGEIEALGAEYLERTRAFRLTRTDPCSSTSCRPTDERWPDQADPAECQDHRRPPPSDGLRLLEFSPELRFGRDLLL